MARIKVLSDNMINLVSAGEVVERPASVVKELVENSIDAKSTSISVEIKNGGKKLIRVSDNGIGMHRDDIRLAFISHATSKISEESDLEKILTLGFRGEALPSICTISKVDLITYTKSETIGSHYKIDGGNEIFLKDAPPCQGSSISIRDLFYNTPARMKFLKKDVTEGNYINSLMDRMILSHPEISFKFIRDEKNIVSSMGDGKVESSIIRVFGSKFFNNLIDVNYESNGIDIKGFIDNPAHSTSKHQNIFINGRWVKDKIISNAIESALESECQNSKISYIIYMSIPTFFIDVNVHPAKTEVRFSDEKIIFEAIYNSIKNSILKNRKNFFKLSIPKIQSFEKISNECLHDISVVPKFENNEKPENNINHKTFNEKINTKTYDLSNFSNHVIQQEKIEILDDLKIIGEIFDCFIVVQYKKELILVDKHAAHERLIFEKLNSMCDAPFSQILISSVVVNLSDSEYDALLNNMKLIENIGYKIEDFGIGKFIVREIPIYLNKDDIQSSLVEISKFIIKNKMCVELDSLKSFYSKLACKSAIKAGKHSSSLEIKDLMRKLIDKNVTNCPHGRPIYISIGKNEIDKKFLRKL